MIKYLKNPPEYEAIRFEGGRESARIVMHWLEAREQPHASWYAEVPPITLEGEPTIPGKPERLVIEDQPEVEVRVGSWIVLDEDHRVHGIFTDKTFPMFFHRKPLVD